MKNKKVPLHATAVLECKIINNLAPTPITLKWKKNDEPLDLEANKDKYEFVVDGETYRLIIKDFLPTDEASYEIYLTEPEDYDLSSKAKVQLLPDGKIFKF